MANKIVGFWAKYALGKTPDVTLENIIRESAQDDLRYALFYLAGYFRVNKKELEYLAKRYGE